MFSQNDDNEYSRRILWLLLKDNNMINDVYFNKCLPIILNFEGGFSDIPSDHGGATNKGIIQKVYNLYRISKGLEIQSVEFISNDEVQEIYYNNYWLICKADQMPLQLS
jgi:lysozyme family protein